MRLRRRLQGMLLPGTCASLCHRLQQSPETEEGEPVVKHAFALLLIVHALILSLGFCKSFNLATLDALQPIAR